VVWGIHFVGLIVYEGSLVLFGGLREVRMKGLLVVFWEETKTNPPDIFVGIFN